MRLVASMITKNEKDRYLDLAIEHLLEFCEEVRVLDDMSTDGTYEYLLDTEKVSVLTNSGPTFFEHEGKARQALLEWTLDAVPDYVLSIDADEFVGDPLRLLRAARNGMPAYTLSMIEVWGATENAITYRVDGQWGPRQCPILWKAPRPELADTWKIPNRKLACGREPEPVRRVRSRATRSDVLHFGWARASERISRAARYAEHDKGEFHRNEHLDSILWPLEQMRMRHVGWPVGLSHLAREIADRASA